MVLWCRRAACGGRGDGGLLTLGISAGAPGLAPSLSRQGEEADLLFWLFSLLVPSFLVADDTTLPISSLVPGGES